MARIVISSMGTIGDFAPFVPLGKRLRARGHAVCMAINPAMLTLARDAGLEAVPCGRAFGPAEARRHAAVFDFWNPPTIADEDALRPLIDREGNYRDLLAACRRADLLIASALQAAAPLVHETLGIRWLTVSVLPFQFPHLDDPEPALTPEAEHRWDVVFAELNEFRVQVGLPPVSAAGRKGYGWSRDLVFLASSRHFSTPVLDRSPQFRQTGFWFDDDAAAGYVPPPELRAFLIAGSRPLVLTFSSLPVKDAVRVVAVHAAAAARLGLRLLVLRGWADLGAGPRAPGIDPHQVHFADHVPHAWLFPQVAAVIHHGGVGTTAQAIRCSCPILVEPYGNDQPFNARRVLALGVGAAMHPHRLTVEGLARILEEKVLTPETGRRAADVGARLRREDGLTTACDLIEEHFQLGSSVPPSRPRPSRPHLVATAAT